MTRILDLVRRLVRRPSAVAAFVGAGGKTSLIHDLAREAVSEGLSVLVTTTTKMWDPRREKGRVCDALSLDPEARPPAARKGQASVLASMAIEATDEGAGASARSRLKLLGFEPGKVEGFRSSGHDLILVEADGSRGLPVKAPAGHEPAMPPTADMVVGVIGLDALGAPADGLHVHRLEAFLGLSGLKEGENIDIRSLSRLVLSPAGLFKGSPEGARRILALNKGDLVTEAAARKAADEIAGSGAADAVLVTSGGSVLYCSFPGRGAAMMDAHDDRQENSRRLVVVRGAGDLASGVMLRLHRSGFAVLALESPAPTAVRRSVAFSEAVYEGAAAVESSLARLAADLGQAKAIIAEGDIAILVDPGALCLSALEPVCLVDAIMAKRNLGTRRGMAPLVVALGPGFEAGVDADAVVETMRGHDLGRVIRAGGAMPDTGIPGLIEGHGADRVFHAPAAGTLVETRAIGDSLAAGELACAIVDGGARWELRAPFAGLLRGMLREGTRVEAGLKIGDLDPRAEPGHCHTVSDKSLAIAGGVLEAILAHLATRSGGVPG